MLDAASAAAEIRAAREALRPISPFTSRDAAFDLDGGHAVARELRTLRIQRGEKPAGRKIGFTNRNIWAEYGVFAPVWGDVYDTTIANVTPGTTIDISHLSQPRLEPEIVLGLDRDLKPGMSLDAVEQSIAWLAHGFEIVQTLFPGWQFKPADCVAEGGLHGMLLIGPILAIEPAARRGLADSLATLQLDLSRNGEIIDSGVGSNVLDGPVHALQHLADSLALVTGSEPLRKGEVITTGTITRAFQLTAGECWSTEIHRFDLPGLRVTFA